MQGVTSLQTFGSCRLHLEFRLPYQPEDRGQARGNSGCYLQGRYEVQMLDSFGLEGEDNECGGLYSVKRPDLNMCFPPLAWQTYDIELRAARFGTDGKKTENAKITVRHNGVVIHENVEISGPTIRTQDSAGPRIGAVPWMSQRQHVSASASHGSPHARHTFQLPMVEGPSAGVEWAHENWLQYDGGLEFMSI
jgi:hypothetical protein